MRSFLPILLLAFLSPLPPQDAQSTPSQGHGVGQNKSSSNPNSSLSADPQQMKALSEYLSKNPDLIRELSKELREYAVYQDTFDTYEQLPGLFPNDGKGMSMGECARLIETASNDSDLLTIMKELGGDDAYVSMVTNWEESHGLKGKERHEYRMKRINDLVSELRKKGGKS